jgi:ribosomal protein S18 acetylase RimI-like enzyme
MSPAASRELGDASKDRRTSRYPPAVTAPNVEIHRDAGKLSELAPLYAALLAHHANLPDVPLAQPSELSWSLRRAEYETWLKDNDGFVVVARRDGVAPGYAVVSIVAGPDEMWVTGNHIAEVQTLCVRAADRSTGIGTMLLDAIDSELGSQGVHDVQIAVVATNTDAIRLYQRRGFTPRLVVLSNYAR